MFWSFKDVNLPLFVLSEVTFDDIKKWTELGSFLATIAVAVFAGFALAQIKHGTEQLRLASEQIKLDREIAKTEATRESVRLAAEQSVLYAEKIVPLVNEFHKHKLAGKYPILSACVVKEEWPAGNIQSHTNDLPGLLKEVGSNESLVTRILNGMEGFAMFFACGVADADKAYRPIAAGFCHNVRMFLPYVVYENQANKHFTYTLTLFGAWATRTRKEELEKEVSQKKEHLAKISVPQVPTIGTN